MFLSISGSGILGEIQSGLGRNQADARKTLSELATGSRINSGVDDAAGLSISDSLAANVAALEQSTLNAQQGINLLQTADGALAQVTQILNRIETIAVEAYTSSLTSAQYLANGAEYDRLIAEIDSIGTHTTFNGKQVFGAGSGIAGQNVTSILTSDGTGNGTSVETIRISELNESSIGDFSGEGGTGQVLYSSNGTHVSYNVGGFAGIEVNYTYMAIAAVAAQRAYLGAEINKLQAAANVADTERINLSAAQDAIQAADYGKLSADLVRESVLNQTGVSALNQERAYQENLLKLLG